jgi:choline dehydrogenase
MKCNYFSLRGLLVLSTFLPTVARAKNTAYVIVGGGPAGFVVAEYLSRNPKVSVTLLEAGPSGADETVINGT